jgi:hypothetical protein
MAARSHPGRRPPRRTIHPPPNKSTRPHPSCPTPPTPTAELPALDPTRPPIRAPRHHPSLPSLSPHQARLPTSTAQHGHTAHTAPPRAAPHPGHTHPPRRTRPWRGTPWRGTYPSPRRPLPRTLPRGMAHQVGSTHTPARAPRAVRIPTPHRIRIPPGLAGGGYPSVSCNPLISGRMAGQAGFAGQTGFPYPEPHWLAVTGGCGEEPDTGQKTGSPTAAQNISLSET